MKKSIWLAIIGAAALTGCQSEVMQQREYVPAPREDVGPAKPASSDPYATDRTGTAEVKTAPEAAPSVQELPAMTETFKNDGVNEDAPVIERRGKKGGRSGRKGKAVGKGAKAAAGEYIVRSGDTPEKIAQRHNVRLSDLMDANNLTQESSKKLQIGQKLVIPAKSADRKAAKGGKSAKGGKNIRGAAPAAGAGEYIVRSGDTPEKIAHRHHIRLSDLMDANNLTQEEARKLQIGRKLVIPGKGAAKQTTAKKPTAKQAPAKKSEKTESPRPAGRDLDEAVPAAAPAPAGALQRIEVENGYLVDVPQDMPVAEFAKLAGVTENDLRERNPNMPADMLKKGSSYIIPKN